MQLSVDSGKATMSSRSGPIRATIRPRSLASNNTSTSSSHATVLSSVTSSHHHPHCSKHSRHNSLDSLTPSLSHKQTASSSSRAGTTYSSPILNQHQPHQQLRMVKSASTGHLAGHTSSHSVSSVSNTTSQCLGDFCPPLNAARLRPIIHETRNTIVSSI